MTTDEEIIPKDNYEDKEIPKEAMSLGTISRAIIHDRLGVIVDAFYGDFDKNNKKIIVYSMLLFPESNSFIGKSSTLSTDQYYLTNEYEYNVIGYLMIPPVDLDIFSHIIG
jgi:hypothetical protein